MSSHPIPRRPFLGAIAAAGFSGALRAQAPRPPRPNVLLLVADDLGWGDVGFHQSEIRTPHLDSLARSGVRLDRFYSYPLCSPTRAALLTGRSPMRLGVAYTVIRPFVDYGVPVEEHFMPETFRAAGYQTGLAGKWHLGSSRVAYLPHRRGFDSAYGHLTGNIDYFTHMRDGGLDWQRNGRSVREKGYSTDLIGEETVRFIRQRDRAKPFFFYTAFNAPHTPLQAPEEYIARYASIADKNRRVYAAMVEAMDSAIGRILKTLDDEGIANDTIVLFFSDNGGAPGVGGRNGALRGSKGNTWEGGLRVPAVLRWPGKSPAGAVSRQMVTVMDVFPTLASAAGVKPRNQRPFDGADVWKHIAGGTAQPREDQFFAVEGGGGIWLAAFHREWKLVRQIPAKGEPSNHLFRIEQDPEEKNDLAAAHPAVVKDLAARLERWQQLHPAGGVRNPPSNDPPAGWKAPAQWAEAAKP